MCVRTHSRVLLVVGLMVIPSYKDSGYESFYLTNLLHLNCKSVVFSLLEHCRERLFNWSRIPLFCEWIVRGVNHTVERCANWIGLD